MRIRDLTIEDFDAVNDLFMQMHDLHAAGRPDLYRKIDKPTTTKAWDYEASLEDKDMIMLGAEADGKIVGVCTVAIRRPESKALVPRVFAEIENLAVDEKYRRKGIGKALYHTAAMRAKAYGAQTVELKVYRFNGTAAAFYKSLGMTVQSYTMERTI